MHLQAEYLHLLFKYSYCSACRYRAFNIQAGTQFCDQDFQKEMSKGKMTSTSLDKYCCIALSGVATEYLLYGQSEGGLNDVQQLDTLLKALQASLLASPNLYDSLCHLKIRKILAGLPHAIIIDRAVSILPVISDVLIAFHIPLKTLWPENVRQAV